MKEDATESAKPTEKEEEKQAKYVKWVETIVNLRSNMVDDLDLGKKEERKGREEEEHFLSCEEEEDDRKEEQKKPKAEDKEDDEDRHRDEAGSHRHPLKTCACADAPQRQKIPKWHQKIAKKVSGNTNKCAKEYAEGSIGDAALERHQAEVERLERDATRHSGRTRRGREQTRERTRKEEPESCLQLSSGRKERRNDEFDLDNADTDNNEAMRAVKRLELRYFVERERAKQEEGREESEKSVVRIAASDRS